MNFKELFSNVSGEEYPQRRDYKGKTIFLIDKVPIENQAKLTISIEKTNSQYIQGVGIHVYGSCKFLGKIYKKGKHVFMCFWEDADGYDPKSIEIQVLTTESFIYVQNIWEIKIYEEWRVIAGKNTLVKFDEGKKVSCYVGAGEYSKGEGNGAAMYSEDIPNGKRYFCNDGDEDEDFNDIIFTVKRESLTCIG